MKYNLVTAILMMLCFVSFTKNAKLILKQSYNTCQSIQNGSYKMTRCMKYMSHKDNFASANYSTFKNEKFQSLTVDLTIALKNLYDRQELEDKTRMEYSTPLIIQIYNYNFDAQLKSNDQS